MSAVPAKTGEFEGLEVYYVINKDRSGFHEIVGCSFEYGQDHTVWGRNNMVVDACVFGSEESANEFLSALRKSDPETHQHSEVRVAKISRLKAGDA